MKVIFDGECPVCTGLKDFSDAHSPPDEIEYIPYQQAYLDRQLPKLSLQETSQAIHVIDRDGRILQGARAVFEIMKKMSGWWGILGHIFALPPIYIMAEPFYRLFARHRHKVSHWF